MGFVSVHACLMEEPIVDTVCPAGQESIKNLFPNDYLQRQRDALPFGSCKYLHTLRAAVSLSG